MKALAAAAVASALLVAACGGTSSGGKSDSTPHGKTVQGGTFSFAMAGDPGNLDPQSSAANVAIQASQFAYDSLVWLNEKGVLESGLATSWKASGTTVSLTLRTGITCADGTPFTAADAAKNIAYVADPKNKSPFIGTYVPAGAKATASGSTVTMTTATPAPFALEGLSNVPMVCAKGMANRALLAHKTFGTGPYQLVSGTANDQYVYAVRKGYRWGPNGAATSAAGTPSKIVVKIIPNETTAANLLLSGSLNAATVNGSDSQRLEARNLFATKTSTVFGEMWFNQTPGRAGTDPAVRKALVQALDLPQVQKVLTSGKGTGPTTFAAIPPVACPGNSVAAALPKHDLDAAKQALDAAGWKAGADGVRAKGGKKLQLTFLIGTVLGSGGSAAAELAQQTWKQLGVKTTIKSQDDTALTQTIFSNGDWDISWVGLNVNSPDQLVPFLSGPVSPKGTNFAHIDNADYNAGIAKATKLVGQKGCSLWLAAEANEVRDSDVVPFANKVQETFGNHASFQIIGSLIPTSIRMRSS